MNQGQEGAEVRGKLRYLQQRNGHYRYIRSIPVELQQIAGKRQWIRVLRTTDREAAIAARPRCDAAFDAEMRRLRSELERAPRKLTEADIHSLANDFFFEVSAMHEQSRREHRPKTYVDRDFSAAVLDRLIGMHSDLLSTGNLDYFRSHADRLLKHQGFIVDHDSPGYAQLLELLVRADKEALKLRRARLGGEFAAISQDPVFADASAGKVKPGKRRTVADLIDAYIADKGEGWSKATAASYEPAWRLLKDALGAHRDVATVSREDARRVMDLLKLLPAQLGKNPNLKDLGPVEAAERNATLGLPGISTKTMNNIYLAPMKGAFAWALAEGWIQANPFARLVVAEREVGQVLRDRFALPQLARLFAGAPWQPRDEARPGRFWLPLLALFTGARLAEIAGLRVADIETIEGVPIINIRPHEGRDLKTSSSIRRVPIHSELIRMGFLQFAQGRRNEGALTLFPDAKANAHGKVGAKIGEWFTALVRERGIEGTKLGMHSFRHTFESRMSEIGLGGSDVALYLTGRKAQGSRGAYLHAPAPAVLQEAMERLVFPGLDLSHLYTDEHRQAA